MQSTQGRDVRRRLAAAAPAALIVLAGCAAYWNSFRGVFVFDDPAAIAENPTIRSLWPIGRVLSPPADGSPVTGRPLVNLSLAVNFALGGTDPWGYHAVNLAIHILAALMLFGIVRRTLLLPSLRDRFGTRSTGLALAVALVWVVHPLQTESVTYVCQRAESLAGLLYLGAVYCCLRAFQTDAPRWKIAAVAVCLAGMAAKETMATVPVVVLLYDRTFLAPSLREAIRRRWRLYASLAATWVLLAVLVVQAGKRGGTAGFGVGVSPWDYARTQFGAIVHYLRLCFWPHPLVLDYGRGLATGTWQVAPYAIVVILLLMGVMLSLRYLPWVGFLGAWFFLILSPTSSVVPVVTQTMAEHRMYLPSAAVIVMVVVLADLAWRRAGAAASAARLPAAVRRAVPLVALGALVGAEICLTILRNRDYYSAVSIWQQTVRNVPANSGARYNLGNALAGEGRFAEAALEYRRALELKPDYVEAHNNLGNVLVRQGHLDEAVAQYRQALKFNPAHPQAHNNLGAIFASQGRIIEAIEQYRQAVASRPDYVDARMNLAMALASQGQVPQAIDQYDQALKWDPNNAEAHYRLAVALASVGRTAEAIRHYRQALQARPDYPEAHNNLGIALASVGQTAEAIEHFHRALELAPGDGDVHNNLGTVLAGLGRIDEAIPHFERAVQLRPDDPVARRNLDNALAQRGTTRPSTQPASNSARH
jgi:tetratricopeptide (TPR) repeat protein